MQIRYRGRKRLHKVKYEESSEELLKQIRDLLVGMNSGAADDAAKLVESVKDESEK